MVQAYEFIVAHNARAIDDKARLLDLALAAVVAAVALVALMAALLIVR